MTIPYRRKGTIYRVTARRVTSTRSNRHMHFRSAFPKSHRLLSRSETSPILLIHTLLADSRPDGNLVDSRPISSPVEIKAVPVTCRNSGNIWKQTASGRCKSGFRKTGESSTQPTAASECAVCGDLRAHSPTVVSFA